MQRPNLRPSSQWLVLGCLCSVSALCLADETGTAQAIDQGMPVGAGARAGVAVTPGEMVVVRDVSTRTAYRTAAPGVATIVNPSPVNELARALGTDTGMAELSDAEYAAMGSGTLGAGVAVAQGGNGTTVDHLTGGTVATGLGQATATGGVLNGDTLSKGINGPISAVGSTTRGIGAQISGALAQFPLGQPAGGN